MVKIVRMLKDIRHNIEQLIALYEGQKAESLRLESELELSKKTIQTQKDKIEQLEKEVDNLKLSQAFSGAEGGNPAAKEKIGQLLKQLDKCIEQLEK